MQEEAPVLEPGTDADASYVDKSIDTSVPVEAEAKPEKAEEKVEEAHESEADSSPADEENVDETIDAEPDAEFGEKVKKRIDEVTGKWRESERLLTDRDQQIADLQQRVDAIPADEEPFKTPADFEYDDARYQQYLATEIPRRATIAAERATLGLEAKHQSEVNDRRFAEHEEEFEKTVKDYRDKVYSATLRISKPMANVFRSVEDGPELAYYLGNNPDVARKLSGLSGEQAGYELGLIKANLSQVKETVKPPKVTKAPPPTPKIKAGNAGMAKDPADMSDNEFRKWREKQIAAR